MNAIHLYADQQKKLRFVIDQIDFLDDTGIKFLNDLMGIIKCIVSASTYNLDETKLLEQLRKFHLNTLTPPISFTKAEFKLFANIFQPYQELKSSTTPPPY